MAKRRGRHRSLFQKRRGHGHTRRKPGSNGVSLWSVVLSLCFYSLLALIVFALITSKTKEFMDEVVYARVDKSIADPVIILSGKLDDASSSSLFQAELHRGGACAAHCLM